MNTFTFAIYFKHTTLARTDVILDLINSGLSTERIYLYVNSANKAVFWRGNNSLSTFLLSSSSTWYILAGTIAGPTNFPRLHLWDGSTWTHQNGSLSLGGTIQTVAAGDRLFNARPSGGSPLVGDVVCAGIKKTDSTDLAIETLSPTSFSPWASFGFDWLVGYDAITTRTNVTTPGSGDEVARTAITLVADPPGWSWATATTPVADFTGTPLTGVAPLSVTFTDASTNTPTSWAWDFGDSGTSTSQNPSHSYTVPGVYTVVLVATNAAGSDTKTRTGYVTVNSAFVPQIIWLTPAPLTGAPAAPTFESATLYSTVANRPAVTGTTRPFASSAALTGALNAASPGDLVQYTGAGILDITGNYQGFAGRRYTGYVSIDLGLPASANHVRFPGGSAGYAAVDIFNAQYLRIYGGEITNSTGGGTCGLEINAASVPHDGSTNHITWWNLLVHDCRSDGIRVLPTLAFSGSSPTAADLTISDCDIEAEVYNVCLDKTIDVHAEKGTGQHCCLLADTDPIGATYPSFLRNRVAIDGHDTGLTANQGGGSVIELGFNDAACTLSGCTLILRGNNTMFNAQQQTGGNGLNLWGDAPIGCTIPFLQHSNATGSAVLNYPEGVNRSSVVVQYGRHTRTNLNAFEGTRTWQIGVTYLNVD